MNRLWLGGAAVAALALPAHVPAATTTCEVCGSSQRSVVDDIVVVNGRVMDPASGLDAVRSIGISRGKIREIRAHSLRGRDTIDARGMVVAPGFIDLHQHAQDDAGYRVEVLDGTTTALELEGGTADVAAWYRERAGRSLINYGVSVGHESIRMRVMGDTGHGAPVGPAKSRAATDEELAAILRQMFARLEWASTGERLTRDSFGRFRQLGGYVVDYNNTEAVVAAAVADSLTMIASDGILHDGVGHPRVAGTFARVLGHYVREAHALSLMDALRKMTIAPARRMERRVPSMKSKGRLQAGADADIVVFDPTRIIDRATYREPTLPPLGLSDVVVNGVVVVRDGILQAGVRPGRAVRAVDR